MDLIAKLPLQAQAIARNYTNWQMRSTVNNKTSLSPATIEQAVRDSSLPSLNDPANFLQRLMSLEEAIGTCYALLIGLLIAAGDSEPEKLESGLRRFEEAKSATKIRINRDPNLRNQKTYRDFYPWALTKAVYTPLWIPSSRPGQINSISLLLDLLRNKNAESAVGRHRTPHCISLAAMVTLFALAQRLEAAEARCYPNVHTFSYFVLDQKGYLFDFVTGPQTNLVDNSSATTRKQITHPFSFIAAYLVWGTTQFIVKQNMNLTLEEKDRVLQFFECAQRINPFHSETHRILACVAEKENDLAAKETHQNYYQALQEYGKSL